MTRRALSPIVIATAVLACAGLAAPTGASAAPRAHRHHVVKHRKARTISFYARVVRSGPSGLLLRMKSGKQVFFTARQLAHKKTKRNHRSARHTRMLAHAADTTAATPPVSVNIVGLQPGVTVLVTETTNPDGSVTITITLPPPSATGEQTADGVVGDVNTDTFDVTMSDGSDLRLHMATDALSALNLQSCDEVTVTYHQDTKLLVADTVKVNGSSTSGDCQPTNDVVGAITAVSGTGVTVSTDQGPMSFTVDDASITDGFVVGDQVDVTYVQNSDGTMTAQDVQYDEQETTGVVTAVSGTSMTITDDNTGHPDTFAADPSGGVNMSGTGFDGVHVGDWVDVSYHVSGAKWLADDVSDSGPGGSSGDGSSGDGSSGGNSPGGD